MTTTVRFLRNQLDTLRLESLRVEAIDKVGGVYVIRKRTERGWPENDFINPRYVTRIIYDDNSVKVICELPIVGESIREFTFA